MVLQKETCSSARQVAERCAGAGTYTTCRSGTNGINEIFAFDQHCARLGIQPEALQAILQACPAKKEPQKISIFAWNDRIACFFEPLPLPKTDACRIAFVEAKGRNKPECKSVAWIAQRQQLEAQFFPDFEEVILVQDGCALEGLSSNFAAIHKDCLFTAPQHLVLPGTILKAILQACADLKIKICFQCPQIAEAGSWEACFICSTSRLLLPVQKALVTNGKLYCFAGSASSSIVARLQQALQQAVQAK